MATVASMLERQMDERTAASAHRQRMEEYHTMIQPIVQNMAALEAMQPFQFVLHEDGTLGERQVMWSYGAKALYDQGAEMIRQIQETVFGKPLAPSLPPQR